MGGFRTLWMAVTAVRGLSVLLFAAVLSAGLSGARFRDAGGAGPVSILDEGCSILAGEWNGPSIISDGLPDAGLARRLEYICAGDKVSFDAGDCIVCKVSSVERKVRGLLCIECRGDIVECGLTWPLCDAANAGLGYICER